MNTFQDAAKLDREHSTSFYAAAFMFQAWISELTLDNAAELAEKPHPKQRSFQSGQAYRALLKHFGKMSDTEFSVFFGHLMEFAGCSDPLAAHLLQASFPLSVEHELTGQFLGKRTPSSFRTQPRKVLALMRATTARLCDWLDSVLQLRVFVEWHLMPECFAPDALNREFHYLSINQRHFDLLDEQAQLHWLNHMSDVIEQHKNSPQWAAFQQACSAPPQPPRPWPTQHLDAAIIRLWPLFKHFRWSAPDLLFVLNQTLAPDCLSPCPDETALVAYCADPLSLRDACIKSRHRHRPEPPGAAIALRICTPKPSAPSQS